MGLNASGCTGSASLGGLCGSLPTRSHSPCGMLGSALPSLAMPHVLAAQALVACCSEAVLCHVVLTCAPAVCLLVCRTLRSLAASGATMLLRACWCGTTSDRWACGHCQGALTASVSHVTGTTARLVSGSTHPLSTAAAPGAVGGSSRHCVPLFCSREAMICALGRGNPSEYLTAASCKQFGHLCTQHAFLSHK
jgi:hypothetical protein